MLWGNRNAEEKPSIQALHKQGGMSEMLPEVGDAWVDSAKMNKNYQVRTENRSFFDKGDHRFWLEHIDGWN